MVCRLFDTSVLFHYYRGGVRGAVVEDLLKRSGPALVTTLAVLELRSRLAAILRNGDISQDAHALAVRRIAADISSIGQLRLYPIRRSFLEPCLRLIDEYGVRRGLGLKWADAIHLRAALDIAERYEDSRLVTEDQAFAHIAAVSGVTVEII